MDKMIARINVKSIFKLLAIWVIVTLIFFMVYAFFSSRKVQYRGVLVDGTSNISQKL